MRAFELNIDQVELFFALCGELHLDTEDKRVALLSAMAKEGKINRVWDTNRTKEQFVKDMAKHYKVLQIKSATEVKHNANS